MIMVVGVNGVGKTTTIGKLAARFTAEGRQRPDRGGGHLPRRRRRTSWRSGPSAPAPAIVRHKDGTDPAAVAYDAVRGGPGPPAWTWSSWTPPAGCTPRST
ncbi:MAG: hypothetical protein MZV70_67180 [Desulfobacterales bacterium]|nr:hypothetical protein [Desulfobacterales bacterium]